MDKPNIYCYHDYLLFLSDWLQFRKAKDLKFSIKKWCQIINASSSLISMVLSRERTLSDSIFYRMIQQMNLKKNEREAFTYLRVIATAESSEARSIAYANLIKIPEYKKENINNLKAFEYLSSWLNVIIRELAFTEGFVDDPMWIKDRLRIYTERKEIEKSLEFLKLNNYLKLSDDNKWIPFSGNLVCSEGVYKISLTDYHKKMLDLASQSIDAVARKHRLLNGHTFAISKEQFQDVKVILEEALNKIENLKKPEKVVDVFHFEMALFPLTKINEEE